MPVGGFLSQNRRYSFRNFVRVTGILTFTWACHWRELPDTRLDLWNQFYSGIKWQTKKMFHSLTTGSQQELWWPHKCQLALNWILWTFPCQVLWSTLTATFKLININILQGFFKSLIKEIALINVKMLSTQCYLKAFTS